MPETCRHHQKIRSRFNSPYGRKDYVVQTLSTKDVIYICSYFLDVLSCRLFESAIVVAYYISIHRAEKYAL